MSVKLENVDSIRQSLEIEASKEIVEDAYAKALSDMRKEINLPGFRKGKVPDEIILKRYGDELKTETVKKVVQSTYPQAVSDAGAHPISSPSILPLGELDPKGNFSYKAIFEIYPEIEVGDYDKLKLEREKISVSAEEIDAEIKRLQMQMTQLEPAEDAGMGSGMLGMIDFKGTADGETFQGSEAENYVVDFGSGNLLKEFEVKIEGMKAGETRSIEFHYPKDYFRTEIAGKKGAFDVTVKEVRKKIVPELNDDFAKTLGNYPGLKEVREEIKKRIEDFKEHLQKNRLMEQTIRQLIEKHQGIEVPTTLIDAELGNMLENLKKQIEAQGKTIEDLKLDSKEFVKTNLKEATDRALGYMLVSAIAKKENVSATDEDVDQRIKAFADQNRQPFDKVKAQVEKENQLGHIKSQVIFEKTLDLIISKAKVKEVKPSK
jgi:trigger factor